MKIFHTADWHIGKIVNQVHMTADQEYALWHLVELMEAEKPDALIIAGDIYDRAVPPVEAVELLDRILSKILLDLQIPVLMVSGNHDSPDRLGFGSHILKAKGLHIAGPFNPEISRVTLQDEHGPVHFYLVPYAPPSQLREILGRDDICDHNSALQAVVQSIKAQWSSQERNVLIYHGFVRGLDEPELSESEKPLTYTAIGGVDYVSAAHFADFTYTALGHLHGPQRVGYEHIRYSGSLLKYSLSETTQNKSVTVVTISPKGEVETEYRKLKTLRDMRKIKGRLQDLLDPQVYADSSVEDYLHVTLTDEGELLEPMAKLKQVYPNILALELESRRGQAGQEKTSAGEGYRQKSKLELFRQFYCNISGREFNREKEEILAQVIEEVEEEERGA